MPRSRMVKLDDITIDLSIQQREGPLSKTVVKEYQDDMERGCDFPPVVIYFDGSTYWLSDGFHRYQATVDAGREKICCEVRQGRRKDAVANACWSNQSHGLRRTNKDKRRAVGTMLDLYPKRSDRWIADKVGVDNSFVSKLRGVLTNNKPQQGGMELPTEPAEPNGVSRQAIETQLLIDRDLISEDAASVAEQLGADADDVKAVQESLEANVTEYADGRKRYKRTQPSTNGDVCEDQHATNQAMLDQRCKQIKKDIAALKRDCKKLNKDRGSNEPEYTIDF